MELGDLAEADFFAAVPVRSSRIPYFLTGNFFFTSEKLLGTSTAEATPEGLKDIRISPLSGSSKAPSVPDWRMEVFNNPDDIKLYLKAGKRIK